MKVERLVTRGFRNLADVEFSPAEGVNIICGDNAQGKTNLLEAIWLFTGAKSFRGARDSEYIGFGGASACLELAFFARGRTQSADIKIDGEKKQIRLNGIGLERAGALSGEFCAVVFSPDHLELIKQGPKNRRRLIDASLCQAYPKYGKILDSYDKILRQRAFVLKDAQYNLGALDMLDIWDQSLVEYGSYLTWMRARYVTRLAGYAKEAYSGISSGREEFSAAYQASCGEIEPDMLESSGRAQISGLMAKAVGESRAQDIRLAQTGTGPHRDDMEISVGGKSARIYASQGQQRSCVLALKLAECKILEDGAGEPPVVLLDDVMSELDEGRRSYLLNHLSGRQVFITCCDTGQTASLEGGKVFSMKGGALSGPD